MNAAELELLAEVEERGVHIVHVPEAGLRPGFSYSVGMWSSWKHPEIIVFGLAPEVMRDLIDLIADEVDAGRRLVAGERYDDFLTGYPIRVAAVPAPTAAVHLPLAHWAYEGKPFEALQVCWPDRRGRWPWEEGVHSSVRELQPVLERAPTDEAAGA